MGHPVRDALMGGIGPAEPVPCLLYHGSDVRIERPAVIRNTGFSDLGRGFYLTDDRAVARRRARSRARREGMRVGVVSRFAFDESCLPWVCWGVDGLGSASELPPGPFGLCFDVGLSGIAAWVGYIRACRQGATSLGPLGDPTVVRAWIATEEVEMACSGLIAPEELATCVDPSGLVTQYCFRDQDFVDAHLAFCDAETVDAEGDDA